MTLPIGRGMERPRTLGVECWAGSTGLSSLHPRTYLIRGTLLKILPKQQNQGATPTVDFHFVSVLGVLRWEGGGET